MLFFMTVVRLIVGPGLHASLLVVADDFVPLPFTSTPAVSAIASYPLAPTSWSPPVIPTLRQLATSPPLVAPTPLTAPWIDMISTPGFETHPH